MEKLNTMDSFNNGFRIERNGEIITLTPEEMSDFRYLEKAVTGRNCLECYNCSDEIEQDIVNEMMKDEEVCFNIEDDVLETVYQDIGGIESDVIHGYIERQKWVISKNKKERCNMKLEELKNWALSEYNEDTEDQLDYYINERKSDVGDVAYLYSHEDNKLAEMKIVHIISRSYDIEYYDNLPEDILCDYEEECDADTSAEFITDDDCYLVWFRYV